MRRATALAAMRELARDRDGMTVEEADFDDAGMLQVKVVMASGRKYRFSSYADNPRPMIGWCEHVMGIIAADDGLRDEIRNRPPRDAEEMERHGLAQVLANGGRYLVWSPPTRTDLGPPVMRGEP